MDAYGGSMNDIKEFQIDVAQTDLDDLRARLEREHEESVAEGDPGKLPRRLTERDPAAAERLMAYSWPGNVRELRNCMERSVALARGHDVTVDDLPARIRDFTAAHVVVAGLDPAELVPMEEVEREQILQALERFNGNRRRTAEALGIGLRTLGLKLKKWKQQNLVASSI